VSNIGPRAKSGPLRGWIRPLFSYIAMTGDYRFQLLATLT